MWLEKMRVEGLMLEDDENGFLVVIVLRRNLNGGIL